MNKRLLSMITILFFVLCTITIFTACEEKDDIAYVDSRADFCSKVNTDSVIFVDNIDFGSETESEQIKIEKSVSIVGKSDKSVLKNVYFYISGGGLESEMITVSFQNVIFDGNFDNENLKIDSTKSYVQNMVTKRDEKRAIHTEGFLSLNIENCDIRNYNSFGGAAVYANYTDGNEDLYKRMSFSMSNCNVYNNFSFRGAVHFNCIKPTTASFINCNFYNNKASYASGIFAGGVIAKVDNCCFKNNEYQELKNVYATDYVTKGKKNYVSGQAIHFTDAEGSLSNSIFENNFGYNGGAVAGSKSTLTIDSCKFLRNTAENDGGAIAILSIETMPTYITNSVFIGNKANNQGNVFSNTNADYVYRKTKASKVEFSLCTFAENNGNDNAMCYNDTATYKYMDGMEWRDESVSPYVYNIEKDGEGKYLYNSDSVEDEILGSLVIDKGFVAKENSYTQAYGLEQAVDLRIIDEVDFNNADSIKINKKSSADKTIPKEIASKYANGKYKSITSSIKIGVNDFAPKKEIAWLWWTLGSLCFASCIVFGIVILVRRRKALALAGEKKEEVVAEKTELCELVKPLKSEVTCNEKVDTIIADFKLSQRESEVLNGLLEGKSAKQIAGELFISFDTARFHIKNLYRKLGVHSQTELKSFCQNYI